MLYQAEMTTNDDFDIEKMPLTGRLTPIGSSSSDTENDKNDPTNENAALIEEQEKLTSALAALTRHVAHVQLRLQQVVSAPTPEDRENLLVELHKFATSGIPDVMCQNSIYKQESLIETEKLREKEFINELKQKLDELEHYAAASGSLEGPPTLVIMEKQRILIDELRQKLHLQLDDVAVSKLSSEELRKLIDQAIYQLTNPVKLKENLITQMRTQINDLEKFVDFLKADSTNVSTRVPAPAKPTEVTPFPQPKLDFTRQHSVSSHLSSDHNSSTISESIKRFLDLTQLYTFLFLTCGRSSLQRKTSQPTVNLRKDLISKKHFGDLRANLEIAIENLVQISRILYINNDDSDSSTDTEEEDLNSNTIILAVRQNFAPALRALLEHGLYETSYTTNLAIWGCFRTKSTNTINETMHIWKLFLKYYEMKSGNQFADSPAYKLSQAFSLNVIGGKPVTTKQCLLSTIDTVMKLHEKHSKSMDSCFKSFVCYALNEKKLVSYLRLILRTYSLVENYYQPWSYTKQTGFNDALHSLNRLTSLKFRLPTDRSVRRFLNDQDLIE